MSYMRNSTHPTLLASVVLAGPAQLEIECTVQNGPPSNIQLETRGDLASAWTLMTQIQAQEISPGTRYRFDVPIGTDPQAFYRVRIDP